MASLLNVRAARVADAAAMARVNVQSWQEAYRGLMRDEVLDDPELRGNRERFWTAVLTDERYRANRVAVAERDGEVIGIAMAASPQDSDAPWSVQLYVLYVVEVEHGSGAGAALLDAVLGWQESALLWVADPNPRAQAFYRKHGFVADGTVSVEEGVRVIRMVRSRLAPIGLGLAALGRPAYITTGRGLDFGDDRTVARMREHAHDMLDAAWARGIRFIDAARSYGLAEEFLGSWLAEHPERRAELTIESKWGYEYVGGWRMDAAVHERKEHSTAMFERQWPETLTALAGAPDLYLIHSLTPDSPALGDTALLDRLRELAASGVRVGISTSGPRQGAALDAARQLPDSPFSAVQATWNLLEPSAEQALARAHDAGWFTVVKEAVANGRLSPAGAPGEPGAAALAAADGQSLDALAIGAARARPWCDIVLSGAATAGQLDSNLTSRAPSTNAAALAALAEDPAAYWAARGARDWT
ncbi:GNAT family N-acetyltransferase [Agromyces sp. SYSU K20354]|uniref:aldo/keto reductase n=1 Tax=Agromyces cavernae TaxID=2898659 RepID=UPI001E51808A|nr:aldo/keto reductase [Agromyces cavernae]MCD2441274.1 GNAT family N-acetyltransferase [Agromyces cavernae]